jgi:hypothetical protein
MNEIRKVHDKKVLALADKYRKRGYGVTVNPGPEAMPFEMGTYLPDLLVKGGDGAGMIVEVKMSADGLPVDKFRELAEQVRGHDGWRFLLVTMDDIDVPLDSDLYPSWSDIRARFASIDKLCQLDQIDAAVLLLWSVYEGAMRKVAYEQDVPVDRLQVTRVRNHLFSAGLISVDDFELCKKFLAFRNKVAHGFAVPRDRLLLERFHTYCGRAIAEWAQMGAHS